MAPRVKAEISDEQYKAAILALENGATKKAACEILGISYSTTRLASLIENYTKSKEIETRLRKAKRGTPVSDQEMVTIVEMYFDDESLDSISKRMHRPLPLIKVKLEQCGAMLKSRSAVDPANPPMIPEECIEENFELKEKVWVAGYNCLGEIDKRLENNDGAVYRVYLLDKHNHRYVYYPWFELGSLRHLAAIGLNIDKLGSVMGKEERDMLLREAFAAIRKRKDA